MWQKKKPTNQQVSKSVPLLLTSVWSFSRGRCFPSWRREFLWDLGPQSPFLTRRRTRPLTTSSASSFQTASRILVSFSLFAEANRYETLALKRKCCSLFVTATVSHHPHLIFFLFPLNWVDSPPPEQGLWLHPGGAPAVRENPPHSLTESSCNTVTHGLVSLSVSFSRFNSSRLIPFWSKVNLWRIVLMCGVIKATCAMPS